MSECRVKVACKWQEAEKAASLYSRRAQVPALWRLLCGTAAEESAFDIMLPVSWEDDVCCALMACKNHGRLCLALLQDSDKDKKLRAFCMSRENQHGVVILPHRGLWP